MKEARSTREPVTVSCFVLPSLFVLRDFESRMISSDIIIRGAREHNLRNVNLRIPRNRLICMTGVSGSGKSSLAFDTLYAEGQRRYVESLSSYARQFLGQMPKPEVDSVSGLAPSISIQQKASGRNPRSTVGTITEIYDYLRVLLARVGTGFCGEVRAADHGPDRRADHRARRADSRGNADAASGSGHPAAERRVSGPVRRPATARLLAGPRRRPDRAAHR